MRQTFGHEEAEQILRAAVRRDEQAAAAMGSEPSGVTEQRLREMAAELGISQATLDATLREQEREEAARVQSAAETTLRREFIQRRRMEFVSSTMVPLVATFFLWQMLFVHVPWASTVYTVMMILLAVKTAKRAARLLPARGSAFERDFAEFARCRPAQSYVHTVDAAARQRPRADRCDAHPGRVVFGGPTAVFAGADVAGSAAASALRSARQALERANDALQYAEGSIPAQAVRPPSAPGTGSAADAAARRAAEAELDA
jgi:hypothetical protein